MTRLETRVQQEVAKMNEVVVNKPLPILSTALPKPPERISLGFEVTDEKLSGGLLKGGAYLVASTEKAGKSSYLRKVIFQMASLGRNVAVIDVEQTEEASLRKITAIALEKNYEDVTEEEIKELAEQLKPNLVYMTRENSQMIISNQLGEIEVDLCIKAFERCIEERKTEVCVFDNVTPLASEGKGGSAGQRMRMMSGLISLAKRHDVLMIVVGHVSSSSKEVTPPQKVHDIVQTGAYRDIIKDTIATTKRPATKDIFGGSILTQFDGKLLLWRPFQAYDQEACRQVAWMIFDDMRHCEPFVVPMKFEGKKNLFVEDRDVYSGTMFQGEVI